MKYALVFLAGGLASALLRMRFLRVLVAPNGEVIDVEAFDLLHDFRRAIEAEEEAWFESFRNSLWDGGEDGG